MLKPVEIEFLVKDNTRTGLAGVSRGVSGVEKDAATAVQKIKELEVAIAKLKVQAAKASTAEVDKYASQVDKLTAKLAMLQTVSRNTEVAPPGIPVARQQINGLNLSIQQIARELPSLAMGPQMFFLAISNNLPIFTDHLAAARREYQALTAVGRDAIPVWRQVLSSIVSWQTALAVCIMLSVYYGKEIGEWAKKLFSAKSAFDAAAVAAERFNDTMAKGQADAQKELVQLEGLYRAATDATKSYEDRAAAARKLQDIYPGYFGNLSTEQILIGKAVEEYGNLSRAIIATAEARAAASAIEENQKQVVLIKKTGEAYERYKETLTGLAAAQKRYNAAKKSFATTSRMGTGGGLAEETTPELMALEGAQRQARKARKAFEEELLKFSGGEELWELIKERYGANIVDFERTVEEQNKRLVSSAEPLYTGNTVDDVNARAKEAAEAAARAAATRQREIEQLYEELQAALRRLELDAAQAEVDAMAEGTAKKVAQIELDYRKRAQAIAEGEAELRRLRGGELQAEDQERFSSLRNANDTQRRTERQEAIGGNTLTFDQLRRELEDEERAWEEYLQRYGTFRERLQATKDAYDRKLARATTEGERAQIEAERDAAIAQFEVEASAWAARLVELSTSQLDTLLRQTQEQLDEAQRAFDALASSDTAQAEEYRRTIARLKAQIAALEKQLKATKKEASSKGWAQTASAFQDMASGLHSAADACRDIDEGLAEVIDTVADVTAGIGSMISAIDGIGQAASGLEKASAILMAISAGIQLVSSLFSIFGGGESAVERTVREFAELNRELVRLKQAASLDSWEGTIFSTDPYRNAAENMKVYAAAYKRYNDTVEKMKKRGEERSTFARPDNVATGKANLYKYEREWASLEESIGNMQVQTRHATWFRSAKYKSLGELLPELYNADGSLNMDALKEFQSDKLYEKLSQENRDLIDDMIANWELYEEALAEVKDYLAGIFGDLGNSITDALVDSFANGTDAAEAFRRSVGETLQALAKDMIYAVTLGPIFEKAQKEMLAVMEDASMGEEDKFYKYADILGGMTDDALAQQDRVNELLAAWEAAANKNGLSITGADDPTTQRGKAGVLETVTQDSFSQALGLWTSIQIHAANIDDGLEGSTTTLAQSLEAQLQIVENTKPLPKIYALLVEMRAEFAKLL